MTEAETIESLREQIRQYQDEQRASLHYIAAVVAKAAGVGSEFRLTAAELRDASLFALERADTVDGLILRVMPQIIAEHNPVLAKAHTRIVLDTGLPANS